MQTCPIAATAVYQSRVHLARLRFRELRNGWNYHYDERFYSVKKHECLGFVIAPAVTKQDVVISYFADVSLVYASRNALDVHELSFVSAKQILRVLSIHCDAFCLTRKLGSLLS
jgi:hypothetical protein